MSDQTEQTDKSEEDSDDVVIGRPGPSPTDSIKVRAEDNWNVWRGAVTAEIQYIRSQLRQEFKSVRETGSERHHDHTDQIAELTERCNQIEKAHNDYARSASFWYGAGAAAMCLVNIGLAVWAILAK